MGSIPPIPPPALSDIPVPEVLIDFSHVSQLDPLLSYALSHRVPMVIATTGYTATRKLKSLKRPNAFPFSKALTIPTESSFCEN
jgi:dihydrodipicolinate reductase